MKKTLVACLAVVVLFAIATSASAITCTVDQRPAATLLVPYFQATFNADGTIEGSDAASLDTLVTLGNASAAPMIAHVSVWSERSELVLDFNIALTGFDIQSFSVASILRGFLPQTPVNISHVSNVSDTHQVAVSGDVCQRNGSAKIYPAVGGFLRVSPTTPANPLDNTLATAEYPSGPFASSFLFQVLDSLDTTPDSNACGGVDGTIANPIHGYITIDHVNYCTLANPNDPTYYTDDAIGMENNLWGDYIYTSGAGLGTEGFPMVALEADPSLGDATAAPTTLAGAPGTRTFYRRYVTTADGPACVNPLPVPQNAWDCGAGDQREPLGIKYAARWFDSAPSVTSFFNVWRGSSVPSAVPGGLADLLGASCTTTEPVVALTFYDEDENTVTSGVCPSPCTQPTFNFPRETQRSPITAFSHPNWPAGWVSMNFYNGAGPAGGALDQAYVTYDFQGAALFLSAGSPGAALDPSTCNPLSVPIAPAAGGVTCGSATGVEGNGPCVPVIPNIVGTGP